MIRIIAVLLIVLGVAGLVAGGVSYFYRDKIIDIGPIHASVQREKRVPIPPVAGVIAIAAGAGLLLWSGKGSK